MFIQSLYVCLLIQRNSLYFPINIHGNGEKNGQKERENQKKTKMKNQIMNQTSKIFVQYVTKVLKISSAKIIMENIVHPVVNQKVDVRLALIVLNHDITVFCTQILEFYLVYFSDQPDK